MDISDFEFMCNLTDKELHATSALTLVEISRTLTEIKDILKKGNEPPKMTVRDFRDDIRDSQDFISKDLYWLDADDEPIS